MKTIFIFISIAFYLFNSSFSLSQVNTEQRNQSIIDDLYDPDHLVRFLACEYIITYQIQDAIPTLQELILNEEATLAANYLSALDILEAGNIPALASQVLVMLDTVSDPLKEGIVFQQRVKVTGILFNHMDFSTVNYIFELIEREKPKPATLALHLLPEVIKNVSSYKDLAIAEIIRVATTFSIQTGIYDTDAYFALTFIDDLNIDSVLPHALNVFINAESLPLKLRSLELLFKHNYSELNDLLIERLPLDNNNITRYSIADSLLKVYGKPRDYYTVWSFWENEPHPVTQSLLHKMVNGFIPPRTWQ